MNLGTPKTRHGAVMTTDPVLGRPMDNGSSTFVLIFQKLDTKLAYHRTFVSSDYCTA